MAIGNVTSGKSPRDLHIMTLSPDERKEQGIESGLPYITGDEWAEIYNNKSFPRLLFLVAQRSLGKTEYNLEKQSDELKKINDWIGKINTAITEAQSAKASGDKSQKIIFSTDVNNAITEMVNWAKEKGITIDIELKTSDTGSWSWGELKTTIDEVIGQLQNISQTLNAEIKNISTQVQKLQSDTNAFIELISAISKKFTDLGLGVLNKIQ